MRFTSPLEFGGQQDASKVSPVRCSAVVKLGCGPRVLSIEPLSLAAAWSRYYPYQPKYPERVCRTCPCRRGR